MDNTQNQSTIIKSLFNGGFLETDGVHYWWVNEGKYNVISKFMFTNLIKRKIVYGKRIDDDTTCYHLTKPAREEYAQKLTKGNIKIGTPKKANVIVEKSGEEIQEKKIRDFLNL